MARGSSGRSGRAFEADDVEPLAVFLVPAGGDGGDQLSMPKKYVARRRSPPLTVLINMSDFEDPVRHPGARLAAVVEVLQLVFGRDRRGQLDGGRLWVFQQRPGRKRLDVRACRTSSKVSSPRRGGRGRRGAPSTAALSDGRGPESLSAAIRTRTSRAAWERASGPARRRGERAPSSSERVLRLLSWRVLIPRS